MRTWILFVLLFAMPALAQSSIDGFTDCPAGGAAATTTAKTTGLTVGSNGLLCFDFDSGFSTGTSLAFQITGSQATVCLDPDRNGTSGAAVIDVQVCPPPDDAGANTCVDTGQTLNLTTPCAAFVRGRYRFEATTAAAGTEDAVLTIRGY